MLRWIIAIITLWAAYQVRMVFPPFIAGAILAYLLSKPISALSRHARIPRALAIFVVYILVVGGLGYLVYRLSPMIGEQAMGLVKHREAIVESAVRQVAATTGWQLDVAQITAAVMDKLKNFVTEKPAELLEIGNFLGHSVFFLVITLVSSIYLVADPKVIGRFVLRFIPEDKREEAKAMAAEINDRFSKYLYGQLLLVAIMTVLAYGILSFNHVRYALVIAVVTGILEIVPMLGPILALALSAVIVMSQLGMAAAFGIVLMLWAARLFEDYVIIPRVIGHAVQIHGVVTIFAVIAGETIGGGLGMLLAVPVAAAIKVAIDHVYKPVEPAHKPAKHTLLDQARGLATQVQNWSEQAKKWWHSSKK